MNDHARLVLLMWQSVSDLIPHAMRDDAAEAMLKSYMDAEDVEVKEFYDLSGDCQHLDAALETLGDRAEYENYDEEEDDEGY